MTAIRYRQATSTTARRLFAADRTSSIARQFANVDLAEGPNRQQKADLEVPLVRLEFGSEVRRHPLGVHEQDLPEHGLLLGGTIGSHDLSAHSSAYKVDHVVGRRLRTAESVD